MHADFLATFAAAQAEGRPGAEEQTKIGSMFVAGPVQPLIAPFIMYYQVPDFCCVA